MRFKEIVNEQSIWDIVRTEINMDNSAAMAVARRIYGTIKKNYDILLKAESGKIREDIEEELNKKYEAREEALNRMKGETKPLTREELIKILAEGVTGEEGGVNVQAAKLLTELEGFGVEKQSITVNMIDYKDAPDYYRTEVPEGI